MFMYIPTTYIHTFLCHVMHRVIVIILHDISSLDEVFKKDFLVNLNNDVQWQCGNIYFICSKCLSTTNILRIYYYRSSMVYIFTISSKVENIGPSCTWQFSYFYGKLNIKLITPILELIY